MSTSYTFICNVYRDLAQLSLNLPELRRCYPDQRIVIISDGDDDGRYPEFATHLACDFIQGERLYALECGAKIVSRLLSIFLNGPGDFLVKFDTDTRFFRPFSVKPPGNASGSIWGAYGLRYLQGGCRLFSRACAETVLNSGLLSEPRYSQLETWCPPAVREDYRALGTVSEDFIVRDVLLELDIDIHDHPEIFSVGNVKRWGAMDRQTLRRVMNTQDRYAVTHPWKLADVLAWASVSPPLEAVLRGSSFEMSSLNELNDLSDCNLLALRS